MTHTPGAAPRHTADQVDRAMRAMEDHTGTVPGHRRAHPRGIGFRGTFTATPEAAALTTAEHFQGTPVDTVVRLSNATGSPYAPDRASGSRGAVLGLAVRFALPSGSHATWGAPNISAFPAGTAEEFIGITTAQRRGRLALPNPGRLLKYVAGHRHAVPGLKAIAGLPATESFATTPFHGLHAYFLVDAEGRRRAFRYRWVPEAGEAAIRPEHDRLLPPQYLISEIKQRVEQAPAAWRLVFQMAAPEDPTDDVTRQWPDDRETVTAGRLVVDRLHEDQEHVEGLVFDPTNVPPGIEPSNDPVLHFRSQVYAESHRRRSQEDKPRIKPE
ncbi:catalase [Streptomyces hygroscopicus]|uniref:catalase family peroxidase n=1 Tax=Streptomyces hygroscopicus TaxID=1912 RepID=UPI0022406D1B|nr:catalase family peroxidase [Streptomyces hygroscopicus]MCW7946480.1 catalase [Streptomyces hygroscopicus]